jgi:signal transduction histidine kinase
VALGQQTNTEAYREALGNVLEESGRLNQTADALLLLARAEGTAPGIAQFVFIFRDLVTEVVTLLEMLGEERGVEIIVEHPELAAVEVHADRGLIRIALMNVLHNALKFPPEDSRITITFIQPSAPSLRMTVQDEGPRTTVQLLSPRSWPRRIKPSSP